ncbi:triple specificity protein phosphatase PtpB-like [Ptychodera flava]|uniref:triple specificity protein phosphatase PtpB-like n=1 Tax=Ptychodera flava TaxID=63121 RepID=UPI00396A6513
MSTPSLSIMADGDRAGSLLAESGVINLVSMPNFRQVYPDNGTKSKGRLYRSSRPDVIVDEDYEKLRELGIRSVIDFRSVSEYKRATGEKKLDRDFSIVAVNVKASRQSGKVKYKPAKVSKKNAEKKNSAYDAANPKRHFLINFYSANYIWQVYNRAPLHKRLISLIYLMCDLIFRTDHFVRYYARNVLNDAGLVANYIDMVEMSKNQIYTALKILTDETNLPAVVNCAHGKDRTGIVVAVIQSILGKPREEIIKDYSLSQTLLIPVRSRIYKEIVTRYEFAEDFINSEPKTMDGLLSYINKKYGSMEGYLESIGFNQEDQAKLKKVLMGN